MNSLYKKYPPYEGDEPYIYYCFTKNAAEDASGLLEKLWERGCRVWYYVGMTTDLKEEKRRHERLTEAGLTVVYKTRDLKDDKAVSDMMYTQSLDIPVIAIDAEDVQNLSLDLRENTPNVPAEGKSAEEIEQALIGTEGFSYEFIGERPKPDISKALKVIAAVMIALAITGAALFGLSAAGIIQLGTPAVDPETVTELRLDTVPGDLSGLEQYPILEKIILSPEAVEAADEASLELLIDAYTVIIEGGN